MRWDDSPNGGFTSPWLPLEPPDGAANVAGQQRDKRSILALFRALMALRREHACLYRGGREPLRSQNDVLAYKRTDGPNEMLIALNIAGEPRKWRWQGRGELLMSTHLTGRPSHCRALPSFSGARRPGDRRGTVRASRTLINASSVLCRRQTARNRSSGARPFMRRGSGQGSEADHGRLQLRIVGKTKQAVGEIIGSQDLHDDVKSQAEHGRDQQDKPNELRALAGPIGSLGIHKSAFWRFKLVAGLKAGGHGNRCRWIFANVCFPVLRVAFRAGRLPSDLG